jgi:hypothetical protein
VLAVLAVAGAIWLWPPSDLDEIERVPDTLDNRHLHLASAVRVGAAYRHRHVFVIDGYHPEWPRSA